MAAVCRADGTFLHCKCDHRRRQEEGRFPLRGWASDVQTVTKFGLAETLGEKSYDELVQVLTAHYNPTPSETEQRFKFHSRFRKQGESVATFVAELRSLAEFCNFKDTLEDMLRDRIVCGINNGAIQKRLLAESTLTYQKALELAQGLEAAAKNLRELQAPGTKKDEDSPIASNTQVVHKVVPSGKGRSNSTCYRCGRSGHDATKCRFKEAVCHQCRKRGHLKRVCRSGQKGAQGNTRSPRPVRLVEEEDDDDMEELPLFHLDSPGQTLPLSVQVMVDDRPISMEVDTGAALSLVSESTFRRLWPEKKLLTSRVRLCSYSGEPIAVVGKLDVGVSYRSQIANLPLLVVKGAGPSLFGRNWLQQVRLDWHEIFSLQNTSLHTILQKHGAVFQDGLGTLKGFKAKILVEEGAQPRFCKARSVPYALREKVEKKLEDLVAEGTLEPTQFSEWASPIVPVLKSDGTSVRICGDFKQTVNPVSKLDRYPIPKVEDLFATLSGGKTFTKLDLSQAYQQLLLDDESKQYVVINTHKGLFRYTRLPYGISSAPGIFQRVMESVLQGIPKVVVYLDDILITGETEEEHLKILDEVLERLEKAGLRVKKPKCRFMVPSVNYLGHQIDSEGLHPLADKVKAVEEAPAPRNVQELKSFLGLLTYYGKFLPNMSSVLAPLYRLLGKDTPWSWATAEKKSFQAAKDLLTSSQLLVHYNPKLQLVLACDASAYGVGAVLAHKMPDGSERPIGYASRSLSKAERNYSQLEREGLACIFGTKKFNSYLFGHHFELITDHKPLLALLNEHRSTSPQASARIKRWSLFLSGYEYTLMFRKTQAHANADALSRLPLPTVPAQTQTPPELVLLMEHLADSPVTSHHIRLWTRRDPELSKVLKFVRHGWPEQCGRELKPYSSKKEELSVYEDCILWGNRVVIPPKGRKAVLQELHEGHPGMTRMKALARMYVWWPGSDKDIEDSVSSCSDCQINQSAPPSAPLHPWSWSTKPWVRLHLDFAGPFLGKMYLVLIDSHSKWIEAFPTSSATSSVVMEHLRTTFAQFGIPETVVTDNGPCFVSAEFESFLVANGIKHITSAPYHPASNGLAERAVQILKRGLKKVTEGSLSTRMAKVLLTYRMTPQSTTGASPAELLLGRQPRTRLDLLRPKLEERVRNKQWQQKATHDSTARAREFGEGEKVYVKNFGTGQKWLEGKIAECTGPVSFLVEMEDGKLVRRHQDQLRHRKESTGSPQEHDLPVEDLDVSTRAEEQPPEPTELTPTESQSVVEPVTATSDSGEHTQSSELIIPSHRYPQRIRHPPERYT